MCSRGCFLAGGGLPYLLKVLPLGDCSGIVQKIENICAYLRGISVPTLLPVAVNLPGSTRTPVPMPRAPLANSFMRTCKALIGTEVDSRHHAAGG
jgi:hypothetical protein